MGVIFRLEVWGPQPLRVCVELDAFQLLLPVGTKLEVSRKDASSDVVIWSQSDERGSFLTLMNHDALEVRIDGKLLYDCYEEYWDSSNP